MNTHDDHQETAAYNPFPEPQTIPAGWDTSALLSAPAPASAQQADDTSDADSC